MKNLRKDERADSFDYAGLIIALVCIVVYLVYIGLVGFTQGTAKDTVIDKARITPKEGNGYYLVYCQNETFQITDSWAKGRFNSSDVYGRLEKGKTYNFDVIGIRVPITSHYRNIMNYQEVMNTAGE